MGGWRVVGLEWGAGYGNEFLEVQTKRDNEGLLKCLRNPAELPPPPPLPPPHHPPLHQHGDKKMQEDGPNKRTHIIKRNCLQLQDTHKHTQTQLHMHAHTLPL